MFVCWMCVSVCPFTLKTVLFPEICTFKFMLQYPEANVQLIGSFPANVRADGSKTLDQRLPSAPCFDRPLNPRVNLFFFFYLASKIIQKKL